MKVNTIEQFKVLEFIKNNFTMEGLKLELKDTYTIRVTDSKGEVMDFFYKNNNVEWVEVKEDQHKDRVKYLMEQITKIEQLAEVEELTEDIKQGYEIIFQELREKHKLEYNGNGYYLELE